MTVTTPARDVLAAIGFKHRPESGYRPELDQHQSYTRSEPMPRAAVREHLQRHGYHQRQPLTRIMGGTQVETFARVTAPYLEESITLEGDATHTNRAVHYRGSPAI